MENDTLDTSLIEAFNELYKKGFRFIADLDQVKIIQTGTPNPYNQLLTPLNKSDLFIDDEMVTPEEKEKALNCILFLKSVKRKIV
ncbi:MAG: hypothetical protein ACE3L7_32470 [Candidatus Pristimantibacillus sp.]